MSSFICDQPNVARSDPTRPSFPTIKRLFARSGNRCAFPGCTAMLEEGSTVVGRICHIKGARPGSARYDPQQSAIERHGFENLVLMCGRHHDIIDGDQQTYSVEGLLQVKAHHEANCGYMDDKMAERSARRLVDQTVISLNQSGGITARTINVNVGAGHQAKSSSFHRIVVDVENIVAARFMFEGSNINGNVGILFYNLRVVNSSSENITINDVTLRYRLRGRQFSTQSHVLRTGTVATDKETIDSIIMNSGSKNIVMMHWHNLRVVAGKHPLILPGVVLAGSAAFIFDFQDPSYLSNMRKLEMEITDYSGHKTLKPIPLNKQWENQAIYQMVSNRDFSIEKDGEIRYLS